MGGVARTTTSATPCMCEINRTLKFPKVLFGISHKTNFYCSVYTPPTFKQVPFLYSHFSKLAEETLFLFFLFLRSTGKLIAKAN